MTALYSYKFICIIVLGFIVKPNVCYLPGLPPVTYCHNKYAATAGTGLDCKAEIPLYVNSLNSIKSLVPYEYTSFDFCQSPNLTDSPFQNLGQVVIGDRIRPSPYKISFRENLNCEELCVKKYNLSVETSSRKWDFLKHAIISDYNHNWIVDNMAVTWCYNTKYDDIYCSLTFPIGCHVDKEGRQMDTCVINSAYNQNDSVYIFNHLDIELEFHDGTFTADSGNGVSKYDGGRLISAKLKPRSVKHDKDKNSGCYSAEPLGISGDETNFEIRYTYSVNFKENNGIEWNSRWNYILSWRRENEANDLYLFLAVSAVLVFFIWSALVVMFLNRTCCPQLCFCKCRVLLEEKEDLAYKLALANAFRPPGRGFLLSIFLGNGTQLFLTALMTLVFATMGLLSPANRGALMITILILYVCLGTPAGYVASRMYAIFGGEKWTSCALWTALFYPGLMFAVYLLLNLLLWGQGSSAVIPLTTLLILLAMWLGVCLPLTTLGAFLGFKKTPTEKGHEDQNVLPRINALKKFFVVHMSYVMGGTAPFSCIFTAQSVMYRSLWFHEIIYIYDLLLIAFLLMVAMSMAFSTLMGYNGLLVKNQYWWWRAFLSSGFSAFYVFIYSIFLFLSETEMEGFVSIFIYFSYTFIMAFAIFLLTGTVGFFSCYWFFCGLSRFTKVDVSEDSEPFEA